MMSYEYPHPVSRTYQYKKITKPLLERKRRARINKCLDELKNLMIDALETEGEDINKLEKADILELTVRHLQRLQGSQSSGLPSGVARKDQISGETRWLSGFGHCAAEAYRFLSALPGEGAERLARHLAAGLQKCQQTNSSLKTNALAQILASLDLTADLLAPSNTNSTVDNVRAASPEKNVMTYRGTIRDTIRFNVSLQCNTATDDSVNKDSSANLIAEAEDIEEEQVSKEARTEVKMEDEEEIDVESVDEADPMWRPW